MNILLTIKSIIYNKKISKSTFGIVEKRKLFGVTFFKRIDNPFEIKRTYFKAFNVVTPKDQLPVGENYDTPMYDNSAPLISVIVPNYNHSPYLTERLESIYNQTYKNIEVILLDDCSTDNSVEILNEYALKYASNTRLCVNTENSGKVFHQWNKGLSLAKGEYIWIAESDDYCDLNLLEELVIGLRNQSVMLSFARSVFMKEGKEVWSLEKYLGDLPLSWNKPFIMPAHTIVNNAFAIKNVVPNVSSALFRNVGTIPQEITDIWHNMKLCGDWLFYLWMIRGGAISYTNKTNNYYRIHEKSTSLKIQQTLDYYKETYEISCYIARNYNVSCSVFEKVKQNLISHYESNQKTTDISLIESIYDISSIKKFSKKRKPSVAVAGFSLQQGGGEVFPIHLANELKRQGITVIFIDFNGGNYEEEIRRMLYPEIPLIRLHDMVSLGYIITHFGIDIIHSHHGSIDKEISKIIRFQGIRCRQVVTLHGMYEAIPQNEATRLVNEVAENCSCFVYIADKNLKPFESTAKPITFKRIGNGLPIIPITSVPRKELGIEDNAFCIVLVSRAIFDKGWVEAIEAVKIANGKSDRPIHLLLIGEGECYDILKNKELPTFIHLLGRKGNVRDYFAMSDVGLLPSKFKGESFPLVVIEALMSGVPVIASNVGEIENMITDSESKRKAGILFDLEDGEIPVEMLSSIIVEMASDEQKYMQVKSSVKNVAKKFDIARVAEKYIEVYNSVLN